MYKFTEIRWVYRGTLKPGDLDEKLMQRIMDEPEDLVLTALNLFERNVPPDCRNRSAFFTSQLKIASHRINGRGAFNGGRGGFSSPGGHPDGGGMIGRGYGGFEGRGGGRGELHLAPTVYHCDLHTRLCKVK